MLGQKIFALVTNGSISINEAQFLLGITGREKLTSTFEAFRLLRQEGYFSI